MLYPLVLAVHSWIRWIALVAGVGATLAVLRNKAQSADSLADRWGMALMMALDIQMLLGLAALPRDQPDHAGDPRPLRRRHEESGVALLGGRTHLVDDAGRVVVHVGRGPRRARPRRQQAKRTRLLVCFGLATLLMMVGMPWPGRPGGRPLFRF